MSPIFLSVLFAAVAVNARHLYLDNEFPLSNDVVDPLAYSRLFGFGKRLDDQPQSPTVCETDECKFMAEIMKASMNESVDPCQDFYQYACGMWPQNNKIEESSYPYSLWAYVAKDVQERTQEIMSKEPSPDDSEPMKVARQIFNTCMDTEALESEGLEPFVSTLSKAGGWPLIMNPGDWNEEEATWQKTDDYYARLMGFNALYTLSVSLGDAGVMTEISYPKLPHLACKLVSTAEDDKCPQPDEEEILKTAKRDSNRRKKVSRHSSKKGGKRRKTRKQKRHGHSAVKKINERDESDVVKERYTNFITEVALALSTATGNEVSRENIEKDVGELVDFMIVLQNLMDPLSVTPNNMSMSELQEFYDGQQPEEPNGNINWQEKISMLFDEAGVNIGDDLRILIRAEDYLRNLVHLLNKMSKRVLVNYVHWNFVSNYLYTSTRKMRDLYYNWQSDESEAEEETPELLNSRCDGLVDKTDIIGYEYAKRYFTDDARKQAASMISHIQEAVRREVEKSEWLNDWAKNFALEKLKDMAELIGYPEYYNNKTYMDNYYKGMTVGQSFYENVLSYDRFTAWKLLRGLQEFDVQSMVNPVTLNAYYAGQFNALAVTAADLQSPLFGANRPATLNYGIIGAVLGHEVNHGFDDSGRRFDHKGKLTQWLPVMLEEYSKRAECFDGQYENYANQLAPDGEFKGYGNQTKNENIADTMGLEACYSALKALEEEQGHPEATLPGFENFNSDQMFFLAFANLWCESTKENGLPDSAHNDEHSVGPLRVRGGVSNAKAFGQAFNCAPGTPMNPQRKCNIWH